MFLKVDVYCFKNEMIFGIFTGSVDGEGNHSHEATFSRGPAEGDRRQDGADPDRISPQCRKHGFVRGIGHGRRNPARRRKSPGAVRFDEPDEARGHDSDQRRPDGDHDADGEPQPKPGSQPLG